MRSFRHHILTHSPYEILASTSRLTEQHSDMRQAWDSELDDIARDHRK
jgi:hypothetical protein